jgi:hypothetical protein
MFLILTLGAAYRIFWNKDHSAEPDMPVLLQFGGLAVLFGAILAMIPVSR